MHRNPGLFFWGRGEMRCGVLIACLLFVCCCAKDLLAGVLPSGYGRLAWCSDLAMVVRHYPRGQSGKLAQELFYRQLGPSREIARRSFAFNARGLHAVTVVYNARYVERRGLEQLLEEYVRAYGAGKQDVSSAPHMISHIWEHGDSRLMFCYAPKRPDMTVAVYEFRPLAE